MAILKPLQSLLVVEIFVAFEMDTAIYCLLSAEVYNNLESSKSAFGYV